MSTDTITWLDPAITKPEDETEVLLALNDGTVTSGWKDGDLWKVDVHLSFPVGGDSQPLNALQVVAWAEMPEHPYGQSMRSSVPEEGGGE
jgi:hypothetical protein